MKKLNLENRFSCNLGHLRSEKNLTKNTDIPQGLNEKKILELAKKKKVTLSIYIFSQGQWRVPGALNELYVGKRNHDPQNNAFQTMISKEMSHLLSTNSAFV